MTGRRHADPRGMRAQSVPSCVPQCAAVLGLQPFCTKGSVPRNVRRIRARTSASGAVAVLWAEAGVHAFQRLELSARS